MERLVFPLPRRLFRRLVSVDIRHYLVHPG